MIQDTFKQGANFTNISIVDNRGEGNSLKMVNLDVTKMGTKDRNNTINKMADNISTKLKVKKGVYSATTTLVNDLVDYIMKHGRLDSEIINKLLLEHNKTDKLFQGEHAFRQFDEGLYNHAMTDRFRGHTDLQYDIENAIEETMRK